MTTTPAIFKKSSDIAEYLTEVLQGIRVANGYKTDLGTTVYRGKLKHDEDRVPYAVLIEGEDRPREDGERRRCAYAVPVEDPDDLRDRRRVEAPALQRREHHSQVELQRRDVVAAQLG